MPARRSLLLAAAALARPVDAPAASRKKRCRKIGHGCDATKPARRCEKRCGCVGATRTCRSAACAGLLQPCQINADCCDGPCGCFEETCFCRSAACHVGGACATQDECCEGACLTFPLGGSQYCALAAPLP